MTTYDAEPGADPASTGDDPVRYLSDKWLTEADTALAGLSPTPTPVHIGFSVEGGPDGDRSYRLVLGPDRVGVEPKLAEAGVTLRMGWDLAVAISNGATSAQRAFLDGNIRLGGDASLLLGHQRELADIDDRLAELRNRTAY